MTPHFRSAAIRSGLALILVIIWVAQYDGPSWAWAMWVIYAACTFGVALFLQNKMKQQLSERAEDADQAPPR